MRPSVFRVADVLPVRPSCRRVQVSDCVRVPIFFPYLFHTGQSAHWSCNWPESSSVAVTRMRYCLGASILKAASNVPDNDFPSSSPSGRVSSPERARITLLEINVTLAVVPSSSILNRPPTVFCQVPDKEPFGSGFSSAGGVTRGVLGVRGFFRGLCGGCSGVESSGCVGLGNDTCGPARDGVTTCGVGGTDAPLGSIFTIASRTATRRSLVYTPPYIGRDTPRGALIARVWPP